MEAIEREETNRLRVYQVSHQTHDYIIVPLGTKLKNVMHTPVTDWKIQMNHPNNGVLKSFHK